MAESELPEAFESAVAIRVESAAVYHQVQTVYVDGEGQPNVTACRRRFDPALDDLRHRIDFETDPDYAPCSACYDDDAP